MNKTIINMVMVLAAGTMSLARAQNVAPQKTEPVSDTVRMSWTVDAAGAERGFSFAGRETATFVVEWGDGEQDAIQGSVDGTLVEGKHRYAAAGTYDVKIYGVPLHADYTENAFGLAMEMVYVEGGAFLMGCTAEQGSDCDKYNDPETPAHWVIVNDYYIGKFEVTQKQWAAVMDVIPDYSYGKADDFPHYKTYVDSCLSFCRKLSEQTGKHYTLPTEAQWEFAARGGNRSQGYKYSGGDDPDEVAWYNPENDWSNVQVHGVGTKKANELGIYDMSGNVEEYCLDRCGQTNYQYPEATEIDPFHEGPTSGSTKAIMRGGCASSNTAASVRVPKRNSSWSSWEGTLVGFRVVCIPEK